MIIWCYSFIDLPVYFRFRVCRPFHVQLFLSSGGGGSIIYFNLSIAFGIFLVTLTGNPFDLTSIDSIGFPRWVERKDFEYFSTDYCFFKIKKPLYEELWIIHGHFMMNRSIPPQNNAPLSLLKMTLNLTYRWHHVSSKILFWELFEPQSVLRNLKPVLFILKS